MKNSSCLRLVITSLTAKFGDKGLQSAKATCLVKSVRQDGFLPLWDTCLSNIKALQMSAPSVMPRQKGFMNDSEGGVSLRFTHSLFEDISTAPNSLFHSGHKVTEEWPVPARMRPQLEEICEAGCYIAHPIPAYDLNHVLINAVAYEQQLRGSTLEVHFTLQHFRYAGKREFVFVASIKEIIVRKKPVTVSLAKRSFTSLSSGPSRGSGSPAKKLRIASD